jgi:Ca2+-binding RTX toxin-like protein
VGEDFVDAGVGNDTVFGDDAADWLEGGDGADLLHGGFDGAADRLIGGGGSDTLDGSGGRDRMEGGVGDDVYIVSEAGDVVVERPGEGTDIVFAIGADGYVMPEEAELMLLSAATGFGNAGNNRILGDDGSSVIRAGAGDDTFSGGGGSDTLWGDAGADDFVVGRGGGREEIRDFNARQDDLVVVGTGLTNFTQARARMVQSGSDVIFDMGQGDVVVLKGVRIFELNQFNVEFG